MTKESMDQFLTILTRETENGKMISEDDFILKLESEAPKVMREIIIDAALHSRRPVIQDIRLN